MGRGSLGYHYITGRRNHSYSIRVEQLAIPLTYLTELKLEIALLIKNLNSVIVGVSHDYLIIIGYSNTTRLSELTLKNSELSKLAMVNHLLTPNLGLWWIYNRGRRNWCCQGRRLAIIANGYGICR